MALRERLLADRSRRHDGVPDLHHGARALVRRVVERPSTSAPAASSPTSASISSTCWCGCLAACSHPKCIYASLHQAAGCLSLERADVQWFLSTDARDLPFPPQPGVKTTFRSITVDGDEIEFSEGFADLHTRVYEQILGGGGFGIDDARPSIELTSSIRQAVDSRAIAERASEGGGAWLTTFVHESSYVDDGCEIGDGTKIWHFCHVMNGRDASAAAATSARTWWCRRRWSSATTSRFRTTSRSTPA